MTDNKFVSQGYIGGYSMVNKRARPCKATNILTMPYSHCANVTNAFRALLVSAKLFPNNHHYYNYFHTNI